MAHTHLFSAAVLLLLVPIAPSAATRPFEKIFAFGDSYTDTGNTVSTTGPSGFNYVSNLPYGMTFFHHPTNRYSDGRLVIDFVAAALNLPFLPPYHNPESPSPDPRSGRPFPNGVNFAVAGSTAIMHSFFAKNNMSLDITPESIGTQLGWFDEFLEKYHGCGHGRKCDAAFEDALVWIGEIGVNDYAYSFPSNVPSSDIQKLAVSSHSRFLEGILSRGAKYIVVQGLPPTGCLPLTLFLAPESDRDTLGCVGSVNKVITTHNALLQSEVQRLGTHYPKATIIFADYWDAYTAVLRTPNNYGVRERFMTCCGYGGKPYNFVPYLACGSPSATACQEPNEYINWDGVHLTEAMYRAVSDRFLHGPSCRPPFQTLLNKKLK